MVTKNEELLGDFWGNLRVLCGERIVDNLCGQFLLDENIVGSHLLLDDRFVGGNTLINGCIDGSAARRKREQGQRKKR